MINKSLRTILIPINISINCPTAVSIKAVYAGRGYRYECSWNSLTQAVESKCAIFANMMLSSTPKPLNKVELTMELGIEDDTMASSFYLFL